MELKIKDEVYKDCYLVIDRYRANDGLAIEICNDDEDLREIFTVCLPTEPVKENEAYIDTNNCSYVLKFIEEYKLGKPTGFMGFSGWCSYPLYRFNMDEVNKYVRED